MRKRLTITSTGMTLIELIITLVISGIIFLYVGLLFIKTEEAWFQGVDSVAMESDIRYLKTELGYDFRSAILDTIKVYRNGTLITTGQGNSLEFHNFDDNNNEQTIKIFTNTVINKGKTEYAVVCQKNNVNETVLNNVVQDTLLFTIPANTSGTVEVGVSQNKTVAGKKIQKNIDFWLRTRNTTE
jgi:prepilin-type N-terminal cleavage/methylation domain-containing protein